MIFKKPYAFLIKYFRLINLALAVLTLYICYRTYSIITFFNDYVVNNYIGNYYEGFYNNYISPFLYIIILLIIVGVSAIIILFLNRKKPIKVYIATIIYYVVLIIFLNIVKNRMISLETTIMTAETARIFRDLSLISIVPQIVFTILFLIRCLGFNLKKFNFEKDIKDFEIKSSDNEEVEVTFKNDGVKLKRNIRRFFREFLYYIKENKFIVIILVIILVLLIIYLIYKSFPEIIDMNYKQGDTFFSNNLKLKIDDSIITNLNYKGEVISEDYYVVLKLNVENTTGENINVDYKNFRLINNNFSYYPTIDQNVNFIDYGSNCYIGVLKAKTSQICSLAFKIGNNSPTKNYKIKVQNGTVYSNGVKKPKYNYITLTPAVIDEITTESTVNSGEDLSFKNSNLGNTTINLSNPIITNKYIYDYEFCNEKNECNNYKNVISVDPLKNKQVLIVLDYNIDLDTNTGIYSYSQSFNKIIETFGKVKYNQNGTVYYLDIKNVTPSTMNNQIVLETANIIEKLDNLYISFIIRNKEYLVKIK